jgi:hypothetical protein
MRVRSGLGVASGIFLSVALVACATTSAPSPIPVTPPAPPSPTTVSITVLPPEKASQATVVVNDPSTVRAVPDSDPYGPSTFYVQGDTITMDDWVNDKIAIYRNGKRIKNLATTDNCCADLVVNEDHYWILGIDDNDYKVFDYVLKPGAKRLTLVAKHPAAGNPPRWITREGQNIVLQEMGGDLHVIAVPGPLAAAPKFTTLKRAVRITSGQTSTEIATRHGAMGAELVARTDQYDYYWVVDDGPLTNYGWIYQLTKAGELVHTYTLLPAVDARETNRPFQIGTDGQVYQIIVTDKTTRIYRIAPNP